MVVVPHRSVLSRASAEFMYVTAALPLGLVWLIVLLTALAVGLATAFVLVGIPILLLTLLLLRWGANTERERAALVLGAPIPRVQRLRATGGLVARWKERAGDRATQKEIAYMLLLGPVGILAGGVVVALWSTALAALAAPAFAPSVSPGSWLGGLDARGLVSTARAELSSGAGDVEADLLGNLRRLVASSGAGDVSLTVPNAVYRVNASSGAGDVSDQGLRQDPGSPRVITATSGAGDVTIRAPR